MSQPPFTEVIKALPATVPFVGPEAQERMRGIAFRARIGANESVFGPSPKVVAAMASAARDVWKYSDPDNFDLIHAVADFHRASVNVGFQCVMGIGKFGQCVGHGSGSFVSC